MEINESAEKTEDVIKFRKKKVLFLLKKKKDYLVYISLLLIAWFGYYIRTRNLDLLRDVTTGKYIPGPEADTYLVLRYVNYIVENGHLMANDVLRYYPFGFDPRGEFSLLTHFIVYLYKFLGLFGQNITLEKAHVLYPAIAFVIAVIVFFLFVRKMFDYKVALLASAFLVVVPSFLYRTMAGFSDKEALAMVLIFASYLFFIKGLFSKTYKNTILYGALSGLFTGLTGLVWGGYNFILLSFGIFTIIYVFINKVNRNYLWLYGLSVFLTFITLKIGAPRRFAISVFFASLTSQVFLFSFLAALIFYFISNSANIKKYFQKMPIGLTSILLTSAFAFIFILSVYGPGIFIERVNEIVGGLLRPFGATRWQLTVAENQQPYFLDIISNFSKSFVYLLLFGSIVLFYDIVKEFKKYKWYLTLVYSLFLFGFVFSRYSPSSTFNGSTFISKFFFIGSIVLLLIALLCFYLYLFYKDKNAYDILSNVNVNYLFLLVWFLIMLLAARSAARLIFVFSPVATIVFSFSVFRIVDTFNRFKSKSHALLVGAVILVVLLFIFVGFAKTSLATAKSIGPGYNQQWQFAGKWIRENTPEDAVFAHWWDYGYWVQFGGERATLSDGGNARGAINHFIGRHVLTAENETEALELLKANNSTHLLIISDEIGKYPAFSSIGADVNYDRYSWISTFVLDLQNSQETRNETLYLYRGGTVLDEDFIYQGSLFPQGAAGIGGFLIPTQTSRAEGDEQVSVEKIVGRPIAVLVYNGQQFNIPLNCLFINKREVIFESNGLDGCLMIIPSIEGDKMNPIGAALYLSRRVKDTLFTHLYLFGEDSSYFKIAYNDEQNMPLALYQGRVIGPLKIWEISYPQNLKIPPEYYGTELPDPRVDIVGRM